MTKKKKTRTQNGAEDDKQRGRSDDTEVAKVANVEREKGVGVEVTPTLSCAPVCASSSDLSLCAA